MSDGPASVPPPSPRPTRLARWLAPAAGMALAVGTGAVIWAFRAGPANPPPDAGAPDASLPNQKMLPVPPAEGAPGLHSVIPAMENGVRVLRIRVTPGGDELIVDAVTGRLLETRPARPGAKSAVNVQ